MKSDSQEVQCIDSAVQALCSPPSVATLFAIAVIQSHHLPTLYRGRIVASHLDKSILLQTINKFDVKKFALHDPITSRMCSK